LNLHWPFLFIIFLFGVVISIALGTVILSVKAVFKLCILFIPAFLIGFLVSRKLARQGSAYALAKGIGVCALIELILMIGWIHLPVSASSFLKESNTQCVSVQASGSVLNYTGDYVQELFAQLDEIDMHRKYPVDTGTLYLDPGNEVLRVRLFDGNSHLLQTLRIYENGDIGVYDGDTKNNAYYV